MKSREASIEMVRSKIRLRHFALSTEDAYCHWTGRYYDYCRRSAPNLTAEAKTEGFLTELAHRYVSARTQNQALAALLFLYREVLQRPLGDIDALRAKRPAHERVAPSREQIRAFRRHLMDTPHTPACLIADMLYGCGLRVSEPLELRTQDILWSEGQLLIRAAKGGKDRRVPLPAQCVEPLRRQFDFARLAWEADRQDRPEIGVPLPGRLAQKYPDAATTWQWFWVFPAPGYCRDPYSDRVVRFHLLHDAVQRCVHEASAAAGLGHLITPHVLRHAYATHSREPIETLRVLMGHSSIETTAGYRHPEVMRASNPLDDLLGASEPGIKGRPVFSEKASPGDISGKETTATSAYQSSPLPPRTPHTYFKVSHDFVAETGQPPLRPARRVRWKGRSLVAL